jgi:hypothetical protein
VPVPVGRLLCGYGGRRADCCELIDRKLPVPRGVRGAVCGSLRVVSDRESFCTLDASACYASMFADQSHWVTCAAGRAKQTDHVPLATK